MYSTLTETTSAQTRTYTRAEREAIDKTLNVILASDKFESAPQMSAFLRFVVEQTAQGRQNRIKAFTVAVDALGKADSFDPQNDPLVRVLAGRLRTTLADYNDEHSDSAVKIIMITGSYVPSFEFEARRPKKQSKTQKRSDYQPLAPIAPQKHSVVKDDATGVITVEGPAVFVTAADAPQSLESGLNSLASEVVAQSTTANAYRLFTMSTGTAFQNHEYILSTSLLSLKDKLRVCVQILQARTGRVVDTRQADMSNSAREFLSDEDLGLVVVTIKAMLQPDSPLLKDYAVNNAAKRP